MTHDGLHPLFAYGSNMALDDLARWLAEKGYPVEQPVRAQRTVLPGWRLVWNYDSPTRRGGAANIEPDPTAELPGALMYVSDGLLRAIDHKEGHPERYRRQRVMVRTAGGALEAWTYVVTAAWRSPEMRRPRRVYLDTVLRGARTFGLPPAHIDAIARIATLDD